MEITARPHFVNGPVFDSGSKTLPRTRRRIKNYFPSSGGGVPAVAALLAVWLARAVTDDDRFFAMLPDESRFRRAIDQFDHLNSADPNQELVHGEPLSARTCQRRTAFALGHDAASRGVRGTAPGCPLPALVPMDHPPRSLSVDAGRLPSMAQSPEAVHADKSGEVLRNVGYPEEMVVVVGNLT